MNRTPKAGAAYNPNPPSRLPIRIKFVCSIILLLFLAIALKAFELQVINRDLAIDIGTRQHKTLFTLLSRRGKILDINNKELAMNVDTQSIYLRPKNITEPDVFVAELSAALSIPEEELRNAVISDRSFKWIKRLADNETAAKIKSLNIKGVGFLKEPKRFYPNIHLAGQLIGFTDVDSKGIEGLEYYYDDILAGKAGEIVAKKDGHGREIIVEPDELDPGTSGNDIVLTIDSNIQYIVEQELKSGVEKSQGSKGIAALMNPETGAVLAMASYPFLDINNKGDYPEITQRNLPIWYSFEPGSTLKIFLVTAALEENKVLPSTTFDCLGGRRKVGNTVINDLKPYRELTISDIIKLSSNVCASLLAEELGKELYYDYLSKFGYGVKTRIDMPGESTGKLIHYRLWGPVELATHSFGQGISVTAIQLATALSAIANGGFLMKPYIVQRIIGRNGSNYKEIKPFVVRKVLSYDTTQAATKMLEGVTTRGGSGTKAAVPGYRIAGKTGTAQVANPKTGGYYSERTIASFIGFAPADDPKITLVVIVEDPKTNPYGGVVAAPIFKAISEKVLFYMGVPPTRSYAQTKIMPNLKGLSARDILKWAEREGVEVKLTGSGYATSHQPGVGERITDDTVCRINLEQSL